ncbi:MAG: hypothetical protein MK082_10140 [Phycisphaerales bacterium]|nr:hypothetical protein [Phycisphaerales bacterium]
MTGVTELLIEDDKHRVACGPRHAQGRLIAKRTRPSVDRDPCKGGLSCIALCREMIQHRDQHIVILALEHLEHRLEGGMVGDETNLREALGTKLIPPPEPEMATPQFLDLPTPSM